MKFSGNCKTFQRKSLVFGVILTCINGIMPYLLIRIGIWDVLMCAVKGLPQYDSVPFIMFGTNVMDAAERLRRNGLYGSVIYGHLGLADCCL